MRVDAVPPVGAEGPATRVTPPRADPGPATVTPGGASRAGTSATGAAPGAATPAAPATASTSATAVPSSPVLPPLPGTDPGTLAPTRPAAAAPRAWAQADRLLDDVGAVLARLADLVTTARTTTDPAVRAGATAEANRLAGQIVAALRARALAVPLVTGDGAGAPAWMTAADDFGGSPAAMLVLAVREGLRPTGVLRLPIAGVVLSVAIPTVDAGAPYAPGRAGLDRFAAALRADLGAAGLAGVLVVVDEARAGVRLVPALLVAGSAWPTAAGPGGGPGAAPAATAPAVAGSAPPAPAAAAPPSGGAGAWGGAPAGGGTAAAASGSPGSGATAAAGGSPAALGGGTAAGAAGAAGAAAAGGDGRVGVALRAALADNLRGLPDVHDVLVAAVAAADRRPVEAVAALVATTRAGIAALGLAGGHPVGSTGPGDLSALAAAVDDLAAAIVAAGPTALLAQTAGADRPAIVLLLLAGMLGHPGASAPLPRTDDPATTARSRRPEPDTESDTESDADPDEDAEGDPSEGSDADAGGGGRTDARG